MNSMLAEGIAKLGEGKRKGGREGTAKGVNATVGIEPGALVVETATAAATVPTRMVVLSGRPPADATNARVLEKKALAVVEVARNWEICAAPAAAPVKETSTGWETVRSTGMVAEETGLGRTTISGAVAAPAGTKVKGSGKAWVTMVLRSLLTTAIRSA